MAHCIPLMTFFMHVRTKDHAKCTSCCIFDNAFEGDHFYPMTFKYDELANYLCFTLYFTM